MRDLWAVTPAGAHGWRTPSEHERRDASVQVDPRHHNAVYVATSGDHDLALDPGRQVVARVVSSSDDGATRISLAGQILDVTTDVRLERGQEIRLDVTRADAAGVRLTIVPDDATGVPVGGDAAAGRGAVAGSGAIPLLRELARAGIPANPMLAQAVGAVVERLGGGAPAAQAVASLAGRDLVLSSAAAQRVAVALEMAGTMGSSLASLATHAEAIAAALPAGAPGAAAVRSLLVPNLQPTELAVARIVQATTGAVTAGGSTTAGDAHLVVTGSGALGSLALQQYATSQLAGSSSAEDLLSNTVATVRLRAQPDGPLPVSTPHGPDGATTAAGGGGLADAARRAALRGVTNAGIAGGSLLDGGGVSGSLRTGIVPGLRADRVSGTTVSLPSQIADAAGDALHPERLVGTSTSRSGASAAAATGAAFAMPTPTSARVAQAIADVATLAIRFAPAVAGEAPTVADTASSATRGLDAVATARAAGADGLAARAGASVAGGAASGDPVPVVVAIRAFLAAPKTATDATKLLRVLEGAGPGTVALALRALPESDALQLAGQLLELLPDGAELAPGAAADLRRSLHTALDALGRGLSHDDPSHELASLRTALDHVAATDTRPAVAADAQRLLAAMDGQQILSRTASGADPGYVYFQVPMPDGRGAEVMVRRDPAQRDVSFDDFTIAFLLDTERLGTLMIELDASPTGIRADVRTDSPSLAAFLAAQGDELIGPLSREARRPVTVTTGVFDHEPPTSLLTPALGAITPGAHEFYA